ncbi:MAG TPA: nucleotidyltransferase domain-containing protein [Pyrinomonadaceae bacterium]|nr:nucleotidyltransferase domain-containing protein [Pyrinomonadaceae bacterium]
MIPEVLQKSKSKIAEICRRYKIRELSLFGSQVRGDSNSESDFDFLVEFSPEARIGFIALGKIQEELEGIVLTEVDLVPKDGLKPILRKPVLSEAEIIYAE